MGKVTALFAGEKISAQELLVSELEDAPRAVMILSIDQEGQGGLTCSAMSVAELALLGKIADAFVSAVVRDYVENPEEHPEED